MNSSQETAEKNDEHCDGVCGSCQEKESCIDPRALQLETEDRMAKIKHKIVVGSGKGGVGKSTVAVNLAAALQSRGYKVGILDADITGPNIPKLLGIEDLKLMTGPDGLEPADAAGIKAVSMALLIKSRDSPVIWRGPMKMAALKQFISEVNWGDLDFLLVDLPPGTSDEPISATQLITDLDGAIIVTTPQEVALLDSRKAINMFLMMDVRVLGIVENMSGLICPHCGKKIEVFKTGGGEKAAIDLGVPFLGAIPLDMEIGRLGDIGQTFTKNDSSAAKAFNEVVAAILEMLSDSDATHRNQKI
ncbi:MAG: ATP-binding protein [Methanothrix sp.]|nr:MAG: ATP-binding protein [Methanothrix sp.]